MDDTRMMPEKKIASFSSSLIYINVICVLSVFVYFRFVVLNILLY